MGQNSVAADELRLLIERVERLEEEKKGIADDITDVYGEAKSRGFCVKTMRRIVRERKKTADQRREEEAMFDLYRGALGMLDGTPLGNWAIEKLEKGRKPKGGEPKPGDAEPKAKGKAPKGGGPAPLPDAVQAPEPVAFAPQVTIDDARQQGREAARAGAAVTANPFPPRDPRRAAWDEAWCHELGSDGMEIPEALRPAARKPKDDGPKDDADAASGEPVDASGGDVEGDVDGGAEGGADAAQSPVDDAGGSAGEDPAYAAARASVIETQYASVSRLQRVLTIGYNRARAIMGRLEAEGVVSAADALGKRDVLLNKDGQRK